MFYLTSPIHEQLGEIVAFSVDLVHATPAALLCSFTLIISMTFVCDGFRATNNGGAGGDRIFVLQVGALLRARLADVLASPLPGRVSNCCRGLFKWPREVRHEPRA